MLYWLAMLIAPLVRRWFESGFDSKLRNHSDIRGSKPRQSRTERFPTALPGGVSALLFHVDGISQPIKKVSFSGVTAVSDKELIDASAGLTNQDFSITNVGAYASSALLPIFYQRGYLRSQFGRPKVSPIDTNSKGPSQRFPSRSRSSKATNTLGAERRGQAIKRYHPMNWPKLWERACRRLPTWKRPMPVSLTFAMRTCLGATSM